MIHWHLLHDGSERVEAELYKGKLDKFIATTNLRAFYMELHEILIDWGFLDMLGTPEDMKKGIFFEGQANKGEFVENRINLNRSRDVFEKRFMWSKKADGTVEFELIWEARAKTPHSESGWLEFKLDLVCRRIVNKEILDGNNKKVLQQGTWEFRNVFIYKNNIVTDYLNKIPIVKNSSTLKKLYLHHLYEHTLNDDIEFCETHLMPLIVNIINKYFSDNKPVPFHDIRDF